MECLDGEGDGVLVECFQHVYDFLMVVFVSDGVDVHAR